MAIKEDDLKKLYKERIEKELQQHIDTETSENYLSSEYAQFKKEILPARFNLYEQGCNLAEQIFKIRPDQKKEANFFEDINACHLNITPTGVVSFSILFPLLIAVAGGLLGYVIPLMLGEKTYFFSISFFIFALILMIILNKLPFYFARDWRMKASNQMVLCIFYIVTYMRHTSNIENAVAFASKHLSGPLALDLKKVLWDVETEKYESIKESLDLYLESWKKYNMEFVEAIHLIESSLYEPSEDRRLSLLDKSLAVMLEETYDNMLHYAHGLNTPMTSLHMLGIILPILGLVILPLALNMMELKWYYIAVLYDIALPIGVYFMGKNILATRPTGYGDTDISEENPSLKKYKNIVLNIFGQELRINPAYLAISLAVILVLLSLLPFALKSASNPESDICWDMTFKAFNPTSYPTAQRPPSLACLLDYRKQEDGSVSGPYGLGASLMSILLIVALGVPLGLYYKLRSKNIIKLRQDARKLEDEFAGAIFQLGNRMGDGLPAEVAFGRVASVVGETAAGRFFKLVSENITRLGMSVNEAIFNKKYGAVLQFPSKMIQSTMQVMVQSAAKGPLIAAQALMSISTYIKEIHRVNERLKDLMGDIISNMKSQIQFLTPVIAGIVVGISSMMSYILGKLNIAQDAGGDIAAGLGSFTQIFGGAGISGYHFQVIVGIYVVELVYIMTVIGNSLENGADSLSERYLLGKNLIRGTLIYCGIVFVSLVMFNLLAGVVIGRTAV
jgi:hypothetical protein